MLKFGSGLLILALASGCQSINPEAIGVDAQDNAALCIEAMLDPTWSESRVSYRRIELPSGYVVTPEQLAELIRACQR